MFIVLLFLVTSIFAEDAKKNMPEMGQMYNAMQMQQLAELQNMIEQPTRDLVANMFANYKAKKIHREESYKITDYALKTALPVIVEKFKPILEKLEKDFNDAVRTYGGRPDQDEKLAPYRERYKNTKMQQVLMIQALYKPEGVMMLFGPQDFDDAAKFPEIQKIINAKIEKAVKEIRKQNLMVEAMLESKHTVTNVITFNCQICQPLILKHFLPRLQKAENELKTAIEEKKKKGMDSEKFALIEFKHAIIEEMYRKLMQSLFSPNESLELCGMPVDMNNIAAVEQAKKEIEEKILEKLRDLDALEKELPRISEAKRKNKEKHDQIKNEAIKQAEQICK